jgi:hypothetical protein
MQSTSCSSGSSSSSSSSRKEGLRLITALRLSASHAHGRALLLMMLVQHLPPTRTQPHKRRAEALHGTGATRQVPALPFSRVFAVDVEISMPTNRLFSTSTANMRLRAAKPAPARLLLDCAATLHLLLLLLLLLLPCACTCHCCLSPTHPKLVALNTHSTCLHYNCSHLRTCSF